MVTFLKGPSSHKIRFPTKPIIYSRKFEMVMLLWITQLHPPLTTSKASSQGPLSLSSSPLPLVFSFMYTPCIHHALFYETTDLPPHCPEGSLGYTLSASGLVPLAIQMLRMLKGREERSNKLKEVTVPTWAAMGQHNRSSIQQFSSN